MEEGLSRVVTLELVGQTPERERESAEDGNDEETPRIVSWPCLW